MVIIIGDVAIRFRIMPENPGQSLDNIKAHILKMGAKEIKEREIGFGIKFLDVLFVVPDQEGSDLEDNLKKIPGVGSVESEGVTLL